MRYRAESSRKNGCKKYREKIEFDNSIKSLLRELETLAIRDYQGMSACYASDLLDLKTESIVRRFY